MPGEFSATDFMLQPNTVFIGFEFRGGDVAQLIERRVRRSEHFSVFVLRSLVSNTETPKKPS